MTRKATVLSLALALPILGANAWATPADTVPEPPLKSDQTEELPVDPNAPPATSTPNATDDEKPWNVGVTQEQRDAAQPLFEAGNEHFERSSYGNALKEYREAIVHRDHPAIRYNMAICLINLDQPIEAYEQLQHALQFGDAPLGRDLFKEGQTYKKLLLGQLAELRVTTQESDANVSLDGEELFVGPGEATRLVRPKRHQVIATKAHMLTLTRELVPAAGETTHVDLELVPVADGLILKRRWDAWKPWAVAGAGAGLALLGLPLQAVSRSNARNYDSQVARFCVTRCDELPKDISDLRTRAEQQQVAAFSIIVTGSAVFTAGVVAAFMNRPKAQEREPTSTFSLIPNVAGDGMSASFGSSF